MPTANNANSKEPTMKLLIFLISFGLTSLNIHAQQATANPHFKLKKGIYFSFEQIRTEDPGFSDSFTIKERTNGNIIMMGGGRYSFELASDKKSEFRTIKRDLLGISDGESFYISDRLTVGGWQGMTMCLLSGPYIIAPLQGSTGQYTGGGLLPSLIKIGSGFLIDLNTGSSIRLSNKLLKKLLKKHPGVSEYYARKENLLDHAVEIINEINIEKLK